MLNRLHGHQKIQLAIGFFIGICFGFLLQKGGVTRYEVIIGQLLLTDFTVVKVMLSAVCTGMIGVHLLSSLGWAKLQPRSGSLGSSALGGLIFGVGFAILGYCPGTVAGAAGQGNLDALLGGIVGALVGTGIFAVLYPKLQDSILLKGDFGDITLPRLFRLNLWIIVVPCFLFLVFLLAMLERYGL